MSKRVVVLTRELGIQDIPILRYMQKLDDSRIIKLSNDNDRFEFVVQLVNDLGNAKGFSDFTTTGVQGLKPSTYYLKLCHHDPCIPAFYLATLSKNGKLSKIEMVTTRGLNELINGQMNWGLV